MDTANATKSVQTIRQAMDSQLLEFLAKFGVANEMHLMQLLGINENTLKNMIKRLVTHSYIIKQKLIVGRYAYLMLDKIGAKFCATTPVKTLSLNTLKHDMLVLDVYFALLKQNPEYNICSERELKIACGIKVGDKKRVPDLLVNESIAIEVELTEKSNTRLIEIVGNYVNDSKITQVQYFVKSKALGTKILHLAGLHKKFKVFILDLHSPTLCYTELILNNVANQLNSSHKSATSFDLDAYLAKDWGQN